MAGDQQGDQQGDQLGDQLGELARRTAPVALAGELVLAVPGRLGVLLGAGLVRGSVVTISGPPGGGVTNAALTLAAAATAVGEWAAFVEPAGTGTGSLGGIAAAETGVELGRCAVVRGVPRERWSAVVGALLDGVLLVVAAVPPRLGVGDARRLQARARQRQVVLVALESVPGARVGVWPVDATRRLVVEGAEWHGLEAGAGLLRERVLHAQVAGKGMPPLAPHGFARPSAC